MKYKTLTNGKTKVENDKRWCVKKFKDGIWNKGVYVCLKRRGHTETGREGQRMILK